MTRLKLLPTLVLLAACAQAGDAHGSDQAKRDDLAAANEVAPYPAIAVLDAFRASCSGSGSQASLRNAAQADGWELVTDFSTTPIGELMGVVTEATEAMLAMHPGATNDEVLLSRVVAGETLYLQMSQTTIDGQTAAECRLYDPGETRSIATDLVTEWIGRPPVESASQPEINRDRWTPGLDGRGGRFGVTWLAEGSRQAQAARFSGLMLTNDRMPITR